MAPVGCPFLFDFFKNALPYFGGCSSRVAYHTPRTPAKRFRAPVVCAPLRPPPRHPFATSFRFDYTHGAHLGGDYENLGYCSNLCHSVAVGLSAHRCLLQLYYRWNCLPSNKTALRWFLLSRFKTDITKFCTEKGLFLIFCGQLVVLYHFLFIFA